MSRAKPWEDDPRFDHPDTRVDRVSNTAMETVTARYPRGAARSWYRDRRSGAGLWEETTVPDRIEDLVQLVGQPGGAVRPEPRSDLPLSSADPQFSVQDDVMTLLALRDRIRAAVLLPDSAFTIVAPHSWAGGATRVYGMPVFNSDDVNRPGLTIDPRS